MQDARQAGCLKYHGRGSFLKVKYSGRNVSSANRSRNDEKLSTVTHVYRKLIPETHATKCLSVWTRTILESKPHGYADSKRKWLDEIRNRVTRVRVKYMGGDTRWERRRPSVTYSSSMHGVWRHGLSYQSCINLRNTVYYPPKLPYKGTIHVITPVELR